MDDLLNIYIKIEHVEKQKQTKKTELFSHLLIIPVFYCQPTLSPLKKLRCQLLEDSVFIMKKKTVATETKASYYDMY